MSAPAAAAAAPAATWVQALRDGATALEAAGCADPVRDARRLLAHALGLAAARLVLVLPDATEPQSLARFQALIARRSAREPVSQIIGQRAFYGHDFIVSRDVLDPRPETETLIALALAAPFAQVLDLGTGSGCIVLSLLAAQDAATGLGSDISAPALAIAAQNAAAMGLGGRVTWTQADWFAGLTGSFDLITANPPYIAADEIADLQPELRLYEPLSALSDGADGLSAYRVIAAQALAHLRPQGRCLVEIGHRQGAPVAALFEAAGFGSVSVHKDLDGRDRVVQAKRV